MANLEERLDRIEAQLAIQQLAVRYAMAVDARDIDAWLALFVDDVDAGRFGRGREALRGFITPAVATFYRSVHSVTGHAIDTLDGDRATGRVYCRAEHECGDAWIVQAICYFDTYARRDGVWHFVRRDEDFFYTADLLERPQQAEFARWPGPPPRRPPRMMLPRFASWLAFWSDADVSRLTGHPVAPAS